MEINAPGRMLAFRHSAHYVGEDEPVTLHNFARLYVNSAGENWQEPACPCCGAQRQEIGADHLRLQPWSRFKTFRRRFRQMRPHCPRPLAHETMTTDMSWDPEPSQCRPLAEEESSRLWRRPSSPPK